MTYSKDKILEALAYLVAFSSDKEYQENLTILFAYQEDLINMLTEVLNAAKDLEENKE